MQPPIEKDMLDTISAIATLITPFLLLALGGLGWIIQNRMKSSQTRQESQAARITELEDKLREDRIATYNSLLEPFFLLFTSESAFAQDPKYKGKKKDDLAIARMLSVDYRKIAFKLSLVANDSVVRAYNELMQFFYKTEQDSRPLEDKTSHWLALMAKLLLEIRKSMGNQTSDLDKWEMIEWFMQDAKKMKSTHESHR